MGLISPATVDRILDAARIEEVVGEFVTLKRSGGSFRGLSPFTQEKTPSFYVVPSFVVFAFFSGLSFFFRRIAVLEFFCPQS